MKNVHPTSDYVLVKRIENDTRVNGVYLVDQLKYKKQHATVLRVGPGKYDKYGNHIPMTVKPGDVVFIRKFVGEPIDDTHFFVRESEILGVM